MTASGPDRGATPGEPDEPGGTPLVPEHVWRLFLEDDEHAIRASAPREPSARDRIPGRQPGPPATGPSGSPYARPAPAAPGTVGEAWRPEDPWAGPGWRELDRRARLRRIGRVLGTATAVALALTAWSQLSTGPGTPGGEPADTIGRRLDESPALPTLASLAPTESGTASPAAFEPAPSEIPRASASPWTID
ncbi:hypothetical protein ACFTXB_04455 [Streptomyces sp. NPDC057074]|uniref:hypothetical protein n=1 Tax=Streptomyces sp. NPDC057074 TaxID=3346015 RepID=UPI003633D372